MPVPYKFANKGGSATPARELDQNFEYVIEQIAGVTGNANISVFEGPIRPLSDRIRIRGLGDTSKETDDGELDDADWMNLAITEASDAWVTGEAPVPLFLEGRTLDLGAKAIIGKSNVHIYGATIYQGRLNSGSANTKALLAIGTEEAPIQNFSMTNCKVIGPGSFLDGSEVVFSATYALQAEWCENCYFEVVYENGNSGLLLTSCKNTQGYIEYLNLSGPALGVKGPGTAGVTVGWRGYNCAGFGGYIAEEASSGVHILYAEKRLKEELVTEAGTPYLYEELEEAFKNPWNTITGATWSAGTAVITVERDPSVETPQSATRKPIPPITVGQLVRLDDIDINSGSGAGYDGDHEVTAVGSTSISLAIASDPGAYIPRSRSVTGATWSGALATFTVSGNPVGQIPSGREVVVSGVSPDGYNGEWSTVSTTSTTVTVTMTVNPGAFVSGGTMTDETISGGIVGDLATMQHCLGEEALGCTQSTKDINCNYIYSHRSGDAACSATGSFITVGVIIGKENFLNTCSIYGTGSQVGYIKGENDGHWTSANALYGGMSLNFLSGAGTVAREGQCLKVVGVDQLKAVFGYDNQSRFRVFTPNGTCEKPYTIYEDVTPVARNDIFAAYRTSVPIYSGAKTPRIYGPTGLEVRRNILSITWSNNKATLKTTSAHGWWVSQYVLSLTIADASNSAYNGRWECRIVDSVTLTFDMVGNPGGSATASGTIGWVRPESTLPSSFTSDGLSVFRWESSYDPEDGSNTVYPLNCQVVQASQRGTTPQYVIDLARGGLGNDYPPKDNIYYNGAPVLLNAAYSWWLSDITLSSTAQQFAPGWWGARSTGGATISRVAGHETTYGIRVQRTAGNTSNVSLYWATVITGADLRAIIGKRLQNDFFAQAGPDWDDTTGEMSVSLYTASSVVGLTSILAPSSGGTLQETVAIPVDADSYGRTFISTNVIPDCAMVVIRYFYTPSTTAAGAGDYLDFCQSVAGPYGAGRLTFKEESYPVVQQRYGQVVKVVTDADIVAGVLTISGYYEYVNINLTSATALISRIEMAGGPSGIVDVTFQNVGTYAPTFDHGSRIVNPASANITLSTNRLITYTRTSSTPGSMTFIWKSGAS